MPKNESPCRGGESLGADSHGGDNHGGDSHGANSHGADSHGGDSHGGDSHGGDSHGADSHGSDSHGGGDHGANSHPPPVLSRRQLLKLVGSALCAPALAPSAWAFGESARWVPAMAEYPGQWALRRSALRRFAYEIQRRTATEVVLEPTAVPLDSRRLFALPFLYLGGQGGFEPLPQASRDNLRRYLEFGGFMLADANGGDGDGFAESFKREMARLLPQAPMAPLGAEHVLFKSFYILEYAAGRCGTRPTLEAWLLGRRVVALLAPDDLLGALARDSTGRFEYAVAPGGEPQREMAVRLGMNIVTYALCLDYKDDAAHLPALMRRRR